LRERGAGRIPVVLGGTLPFEDSPRLEALGIRAILPAGTPAVEFQEKIRELASGREQRLVAWSSGDGQDLPSGRTRRSWC